MLSVPVFVEGCNMIILGYRRQYVLFFVGEEKFDWNDVWELNPDWFRWAKILYYVQDSDVVHRLGWHTGRERLLITLWYHNQKWGKSLVVHHYQVQVVLSKWLPCYGQPLLSCWFPVVFGLGPRRLLAPMQRSPICRKRTFLQQLTFSRNPLLVLWWGRRKIDSPNHSWFTFYLRTSEV